jgi:hypothetical protein
MLKNYSNTDNLKIIIRDGATAHLKEIEKTFTAQNGEYNEAISAVDAALELLS